MEGACGKMSVLKKFTSNASNIRMIIGIDLLEDSIRLNNDMDFKTVANLENLPFKEKYFDVVSLPNVLEHLPNPEKVFREVEHVLKKGGILLLTTKNIYNPIMSIQRLLPLTIRCWLKKKILKSPGHYQDTFYAPYLCNSATKIKKVLENLGFKEEMIWLWGYPLIKTPLIGLFFSMIYEKLTDSKWLRFSKPCIWVKYKKI